VTATQTQNFIEGLRVLGGWLSKSGALFYVLSEGAGNAGANLQWLANKASYLINPLSTVVSLIERIGRARRIEQRTSDLMNGSFSTDFIAGELAAMNGGAASLNAPGGLPAVATNLGKVGSSARSAASDAREAQREFQSLYDRLRPREAADRQIEADTKLIQSRKDLTQATKNELIALIELEAFRDRARGLGPARVSEGLLNQGSLAVKSNDMGLTIERINAEQAARQVLEGGGTVAESLKVLEQKSRATTVTIAESFAQMAQKITSSLQGLANSIRSGDFLGILGGVLDIFTQLGSAGVFGSGLAGRLNATPSNRSMGGPVYAGSPYIVGENGPELFTPPGTGKIVANDNIRSPEKVIVINNNPMADVYVDGRIIQSAPVVANAGALQAQAQMARSNRRRVR
jgi:hypothetical protein